MSRKERERMTIMAGIKNEEVTLAAAAPVLVRAELSADPTGLAALSGSGRCRAGAPLTGSAQLAAQAGGVAGPRAGPIPPALSGLWADAGCGVPGLGG